MADFEFTRKLGAGAFGEVWLATDRALGAVQAVKLVRPERISTPSNFYNEPQVLRTLRHENVVAVENAGTLPDGRLYIAMEHLPAGSVEQRFASGIVPLRDAVRIVCDACRGAEYAHGRGFVHRDIKPGNILLTEGGVAKLSDFGLATRTNENEAASPNGYIAHLAPEVFANATTNRQTDVYALGVTLYRMVNGDGILPSLELEALREAIIQGNFPRRQDYRPFVPRSLRTAINRAMNPDTALRFPSAAAFRQALESIPLHCDWRMEPLAGGMRWTARTNQHEFTCTEHSNGRGSNSFETTKSSIGGTARKVTDDCMAAGSRGEIRRFSHEVLGRITANGR